MCERNVYRSRVNVRGGVHVDQSNSAMERAHSLGWLSENQKIIMAVLRHRKLGTKQHPQKNFPFAKSIATALTTVTAFTEMHF